MNGEIQCPKCQNRFALPARISDNRVWCPSCGCALTRRYSAESEQQSGAAHGDPGDLTTARPTASVTAPRRLQTSNRSDPPAVSAPESGQDSWQFELPGGVSTTSVDSVYPFRRPKRIWPGIVAALLATGLIGGLFLLVAWMAGGQNEAGQPDPDALAVVDDPATESADPDSNEDDDARQSKGLGQPKPLPPVLDSPDFFSQRQWDQAWRRVNGYLVRLEIETPIATRQATGLIVDSRGWVATSLSAIQDAGRVRVTVAAQRLDDEPQWLSLSDEARGVIASDPQADLAIIAINRSQVINLADPELANDDRLVAAHRLLIARTPPPRHRPWITECRIDRRASYADLDPEFQSAIDAHGLHADAFRWVVYAPKQTTSLAPQLAGSPIIDLNGKVMAMNTGHTVNGNALAFPASSITALLKTIPATPPASPFARASEMNRLSDAMKQPAAAGKDSEIPDDEFSALVTQVEEGVRRCRETDWSADNAAEYTTFQNLVRDIVAAQEWLETNSPVEDQYEARARWLQDQLDAIVRSMTDDMEIDEFDSGKSNQWFATAINPENPWCVLAVTVHKDPIMTGTVNRQPACTLKILGTNEIIVAPLLVDGRQYREGRKFLIFGKVKLGDQLRMRENDEAQMVKIVEVHASFWMNERTASN